ncbi:cadherin-like beta sandwich domain-containing protein [Clostridium sp. BL-8]|uniref:N-acetylmuramoyl-L-alanine amidase family protein n=1 Tax=Clostridium sp. BL-8 TaxID=349938 RepID=UPI00098C6E27|nr:cadherin-like beta sandwich domain-containing protein [Clostridium sp. BL-8]OOM71284.1 putative endo-beta-N-acetylglucosaminidase precursor [Clostridium sp. BL-8]
MNKRVKVRIAGILAIISLSIYAPTDISLLTTNAYAEAATYSLADNGELKSLDVQSTNGQSLELCNNYGGEEKSLTDDKNYYVVLDSNSDGVKISAETEGDYIVKVFESDRDFATPYDLGENIPIETGQTTLYIRTYATEDGFKRAVDDEEVSNCAKTYEINIQKESANENEDLGLDELTLDSGKVPINFDIDTINYNISVNNDEEEVEIKARPRSDKYTVKIQGYTADEDNKYRKDIHLQYGLNVVKIVVADLDYRIKTYTLNITRGSVAGQNASTSTSNTQNNSGSNIKISQWVQVNGAWHYNDSTGNPLKNTWYYDRSYGKYYYLKEDGTMATQWVYLNGNWYYLGQDGGMKTGWQYINGKYYYLQSDGSMAKSTEISGYKLGDDGAWIK